MKVLFDIEIQTGSESAGLEAFSTDSNGKLEWRNPWKSAWALSTAYAVGEKVSHNGSSYTCISAHTSSASDEPEVGGSWTTYWAILASKGDTGATGATGAQGPAGNDGSDGDSLNWRAAWATATSYALLDAVKHNGASYICTVAHTSGASTEPGVGGSWTDNWDVLAEKGDTGATGATGAQGPQGNTGATGAQGPAGNDGNDGADGTSDLPRGFVGLYLDTLDGVSAESFSSDWIMLGGGTTTNDASTWGNKTVLDMDAKFARGSKTTTGSSGGTSTHTHDLSGSSSQFNPTLTTGSFYAIGTQTIPAANHLPPYIEFEYWMKWRST